MGEGDYHLDVLKEIQIKDSYLELDEDVRGCQNEEPFDNCTTRQYIDSLLKTCGCVPYSINLSRKGPMPICSSKELACVKRIEVNNSNCMPFCSGLILTSFSKNDAKKDMANLLYEEVMAYKQYMKWLEFPHKHYEKTCSGMNSFRIGMNLFRIGMNSFRIGMKSFRIDTGIWGNEKCQKIKLFM